jgi:ABC-type multidrug transport system ATPase subunit
MLEARLLTKYFNRKPVVKDVSFTIRQNAMKYPASEYSNPGLE